MGKLSQLRSDERQVVQTGPATIDFKVKLLLTGPGGDDTRFQQTVAFLGSAAVGPGVLAGWDEATDAAIGRWTLAYLMLGAMILTWGVLGLLLRKRDVRDRRDTAANSADE